MNRVRAGLWLAGVVVLAAASLWWLRDGLLRPRTSASTDQDGRRAIARHRGARPQSSASPPHLAPRTASISGWVRDPRGQAIAGARVCARAEWRDLGSDLAREPVCADSDPRGAYRIGGLYPVSYGVTAAAKGFGPAPFRGAGGPEVELKVGEARTGVDLVLRPGGVEVRGVVKDVTGGVIAGATVASSESAVSWLDAARTNDKGEFSLWVDRGEVRVLAQADGYTRGGVSGPAPGHYFIVTLIPESVLEGRVVDAASRQPIEGAVVTARAVEPGVVGFGRSFSDDEGRFRIRGLTPARYGVEATKDKRHASLPSSLHLGLGATSRDLIVELPAADDSPTFAVHGRVVKAGSGKPCPGATVWMGEAKGTSLAEDPDGRVVIDGVPAGKHPVGVSCDGYVARRYPPVVVDKNDVTGLVWEVDPALSIRGRLVDEQGGPVFDAIVTAQKTDPAGSDNDYARGGPDGEFFVDGLLPGRYRVEVCCAPRHVEPDPVDVLLEVGRSVNNLAFVLESGGSIEGTVVDDKGRPVAGAWVYGSVHGDVLQATSRDDGTFEMAGVPAGECKLNALVHGVSASSPGGKPVRVQVQAGRVTHTRLSIESLDATIAGRVTDERGNVIPDAFVQAAREPDAPDAYWSPSFVRYEFFRMPVATDDAGEFVVTGLAKGRYLVRADQRGGGETLMHGVETGSNITLVIRALASVSGAVTLDGKPFADAFSLLVRDPATGLVRGESFAATGGRWTVEDLPAGTYQIYAQSSPGAAQQTIRLDKGQHLEGIQLALLGYARVRGLVVGPDGTPVAGAHVLVKLAEKGTLLALAFATTDATTDGNGRFDVDDAPVGDVSVQAWSPEGPAEGSADAAAHTSPNETTDIPPMQLEKPAEDSK